MNREELKNVIDLYTSIEDDPTSELLTTLEKETVHLAKGMLGILDSIKSYTFIDPGVQGAINQATRPLYTERTQR